MQGNTGSGDVGGCGLSGPKEMEAKLRARKLKSHIHRKWQSGQPLEPNQGQGSNRDKIHRCGRVERQPSSARRTTNMGGTLVRTRSSLVRAKANDRDEKTSPIQQWPAASGPTGSHQPNPA